MYRYPRLTLLAFIYVVAFICAPLLTDVVRGLVATLGLPFAVVLGYLYSFSFTGSLSSVMIYELGETSFLFVFLCAVGSMVGDMTMYRIVQTKLGAEIHMLYRRPFMRSLARSTPLLRNKTLRAILGFIVIGSPLPDEIGILLLSGAKISSSKVIIPLSILANFVGLYGLSWLGRLFAAQ
jgi:hypothetical protein